MSHITNAKQLSFVALIEYLNENHQQRASDPGYVAYPRWATLNVLEIALFGNLPKSLYEKWYFNNNVTINVKATCSSLSATKVYSIGFIYIDIKDIKNAIETKADIITTTFYFPHIVGESAIARIYGKCTNVAFIPSHAHIEWNTYAMNMIYENYVSNQLASSGKVRLGDYCDCEQTTCLDCLEYRNRLDVTFPKDRDY
jgi:hypothetical protein